MRRLLPSLLLAACAPIGAATRHPLCIGAIQSYELLPATQPGPRPALVLLHGAGGTPASVLEPWRALAALQGVVLLAPRVPRVAAFEAAAPQVLRCLVEDAARTVPVDPRRIYLFGYSMGGALAVDAALAEPGTFAAAALFAPAIDEQDRAALDLSGRKFPFALYASTSDRIIPIQQVRRTRDLLRDHGFPTHFLELAGQGHAYAPVADQVNPDAWAFLTAQVLPGP